MNASYLAPRRYRRWSGTLAYGLASFCLLGIGLHHFHHQQRLTSSRSSAWVCQRALTLASVFSDTVRVADAPEYMHHTSWDLTCQADTLTIHMRFDDATGRLQSLTTEIPPHWSGRLVAPLETAAEARAVGLHRLYDLQMIPTGSHPTLTQSPVQIKPKSALETYRDWQMVWLVTPAEGDTPIQIRLILDRRSGLPIYCAARKWLNHNFRHFSVPIGWQHVASPHPRLRPNY